MRERERGGVGGWERQTERETDREKERGGGRETDRQKTEREKYGTTHRQAS